MAKDPEDPGTVDLFCGTSSRKTQQLVEANAALVETPPTIDRADFMHAVLCQVGMPRRKSAERQFERTSGGASMFLEAGRLWNGMKWVSQPLPYGPKPRMAMIHVTTEAVRNQSRTVSLGTSFRQFMLTVGLDPQGSEFRSAKAQIRALAACRMTLGVTYGGKAVTVDAKPFRRFEAWISPDDDQSSLWPAELELSQDFYDSLREFAVPLAHEALAALKGSALALDTYTWLAHRLCRVRRPGGEKVSWANLRDQFGQEYADPKDFKKKFRPALRQALAVYPDARIDEDAVGGIVLLPSKPPIPKTLVTV